MGSCLSAFSSDSATNKGKWRTWIKKSNKTLRKATGAAAADAAGAERKEEEELNQIPLRMVSNGSSDVACLHTQQGKKGTNQDAMIVWEDFGSRSDTIFCGVFDGHGPNGHFVARKVRNSLPLKISDQWKSTNENGMEISSPHHANNNSSLPGSMDSEETGSIASVEDEMSDVDDKLPEIYFPTKKAFKEAYKSMDKELKFHRNIDSFCSGCTAVTILKQGQDLIIGNIGDSRAVLGTRDIDNNLIPVQLTVDLKPNLPREEERIKKCKGRVFALHDEPDVARVWLPNNDSPGLAMARAFGDFCLKDYGLISVPDISHYQLTHKDEFVILATDGVWDALSNTDAVRIVASAPFRSIAARAVVECAVRAWRIKYPTSKVDDCAAICLFFDPTPPISEISQENQENNEQVDNSSLEVIPDIICGCDEIEPSLDDEQEEVEKEKEEGRSNASLKRMNTIFGCNEIEQEIEEEKIVENKEAERSQSTRSLAEFMSVAEEEEWSALEGVTRVNSLLSIPRILSREKKPNRKSV